MDAHNIDLSNNGECINQVIQGENLITFNPDDVLITSGRVTFDSNSNKPSQKRNGPN